MMNFHFIYAQQGRVHALAEYLCLHLHACVEYVSGLNERNIIFLILDGDP